MDTSPQPASTDRLLAAGGVVGAVLASSCCVLPLALVAVGLSGAWVSRLTALAPFKPYALAGTTVVLAAGFWHVYGRKAPVCAPGSACAAPRYRRFTKAALWAGAGLAVLSASVDVWAPLFW